MLFEIPEGNAQYDDWARECGYFILAFGHIESLTHSLERHALGERFGEDTKTVSGRRPRLDVLIEAAEAKGGQKHWGTITQLLREIKLLAKTRNLIAHNGLAVESEPGSAGDPKLRVIIRSTTNLSVETRVDFVKLKEYRHQAMQLHRELAIATMYALVQDESDRLEEAYGGEEENE